MVAAKNRPPGQAHPLAPAAVGSAADGPVHVRLASGASRLGESFLSDVLLRHRPREVGVVCHQQLLAQPPRSVDHRPDLSGLRVSHGLCARLADLLHLCLSLWGNLRPRRPILAGPHSRLGSMQAVRPMHRNLHQRRPRPRRSQAARHDRQPRLHEVPRLRLSLPAGGAALRLGEAGLVHLRSKRWKIRTTLRILDRRGASRRDCVPRGAAFVPWPVQPDSVPAVAGTGSNDRLLRGPLAPTRKSR